MRAAVLLAGHLRTHEKLYDHFHTHVMGPLQPDLFIHTWSTLDSTTPTWWRPDPPSEMNMDCNKLQAMYNPQMLEIEDPKDFYKPLYNRVNERSTLGYEFVVSMWYSWWRAMGLCRQYENENGFRYDLVLRTRGDLEIFADFRLQGDAVVTGWHCEPRSMCDLCAYGPSVAIEALVDVYRTADDYATIERCCMKTDASPVQICPEFALKNHCDHRGIRVTRDPTLKRFLHRPDGHVLTHLNDG
jgi:hypothetical protein